ncbi:MAG: hypothetical protein KBS86_00840 [Proteobacteria bacterium]|nr:hypothetical protein [Candidatus Enterousia scatequi]
MKHFLFVICTATMITGYAFAGNMEHPMYLPSAGDFYSKSGMGLMYKRSDHTEALKKKHMDGNDEFPIWRFTEDLGYGITDRLAVHGRFGWTQDDSINRKGMHRGRVGLTYRILADDSPILWDVYGEAYLSALMPMEGKYSNGNFTYDNYSNGRWGMYGGTKLGKTWGNFTLSAYGEYLQTFGNHNNKVRIDQNSPIAVGVPITMGMVGIPSEISVDLASTHEINSGINAFVQLSKKWSVGGGFEFIEHRDNSIKSIHTKLNESIVGPEWQQKVVDSLLAQTADMNDGWNEYVLKVVGAYQMTDMIQFAAFAEYTFDKSHAQSQNGTDIKAEAGVRVNVVF